MNVLTFCEVLWLFTGEAVVVDRTETCLSYRLFSSYVSHAFCPPALVTTKLTANVKPLIRPIERLLNRGNYFLARLPSEH